MKPLSDWPHAARCSLRGVFFDIDDTFTTDGRITAEAYAALEMMQRAGLLLVPITGRPAGWCDHIARMWPVDAVVGENGAFFFRYDRERRSMHRRYLSDAETRHVQREELNAIADEIVRSVPGSAIAADQPYRETDLAIDYCEDVPRLPESSVDEIVRVMRARGLTAKVSSIHVNGWFGASDKLGMTQTLMLDSYNVDLAAARDRYAFIGDSPNDVPMFHFFPNAIGVANVRDFEARIAMPPRYVTAARAGAGFREVADAIVASRGSAR
jgi:hypothetical protein